MEDFWVALAGPLTHIFMGAAWFGIYIIFEPYDDFDLDPSWDQDSLSTWDGFLSSLAYYSLYLNAGLFIFNVFVPAYPMDGGRIMAALLVSLCCCTIQLAAYTTALVALALAAAMALWAVYDLFWHDKDEANGGAPLILLLIAVWIGLNSLDLLRYAWQGRAVDHVLFDKQCYRRRAGVAEPDSSSFGGGGAPPPPAPVPSPSSESQLSRRELRQQQRESKRRAKEEQKRAKKQQNGKGGAAETDFEEPTHTMPVVGEQEPPPQPIDVALSPAGAGTSWTTFNSTPPPAEPMSEPPPDLDGDGKKRGSGFGRLFGKKTRPSQSAIDDDFVV